MIGDLLRLSGEFLAEQQRIQDEANKKRAEAAKAQIAEQSRNEAGQVVVRVVPQVMARPGDPEPAPEPESPKSAVKKPERSAAVMAAKIGVNRGAVDQALTLQRDRPDLAEKVKAGEMKPTEALRLMRNVKKIERIKALPEGQYHVIYADPPWQYSDKREVSGFDSSSAEHHYPTVPLAELKVMDIKKMAGPDCVLFCWATFPLLPDALELLGAWGFAYKTAFIWDKGAGAFGHYHNAAAELLMVATRGSGIPQLDKREDQVLDFKREEHSRKPAAWRDMIDRLYPDGPRIELFRRGDAPPGWDIWGAEAETVEVETNDVLEVAA